MCVCLSACECVCWCVSVCVVSVMWVLVSVCVCVPGLSIPTLTTLHAYHHGLHADGWCVYVGVCILCVNVCVYRKCYAHSLSIQ